MAKLVNSFYPGVKTLGTSSNKAFPLNLKPQQKKHNSTQNSTNAASYLLMGWF